MPKKESIILPPKYYLDYFSYLVSFVEKHSHVALGEIAIEFISEFRAISEDAQCLMLRMANRKGEYFRLGKFNYIEIENLGAAAEILIEKDFASLDLQADPLLFRLFTKAELCKLFPHLVEKSMKKGEILLSLEQSALHEDYQTLFSEEAILYFAKQEIFEFLKLIFFGHRNGLMTEFVVRDIGHVKLENLEGHNFTPWFDSHEEAVAVFELSKLDQTIRHYMTIGLPDDLLEMIAPMNWSNLINFPNARRAADKLMLRLGEYFEKLKYWDDALSYYALAKKHPARERQVRIYDKTNRQDEAKDLAAYILINAYNASEQIFAKDYLAKIGARALRSTTDRIKLGLTITIAKESSSRVEHKALQYFADQGYEGMHSENYLWRALFALIFWDELFSVDTATFHHPLQRAPSDLHATAFYEMRHGDLLTKLKSLRTKKQMTQWVLKIYAEKEGITNPLFGWHPDLPLTLSRAITLLPMAGLKKVLMEMAKNVKDNCTGFPDLFVWKGKDYHFYEIKSPNDHLSSQQLFWLDFFAANKIKSEIVRVRWGDL